MGKSAGVVFFWWEIGVLRAFWAFLVWKRCQDSIRAERFSDRDDMSRRCREKGDLGVVGDGLVYHGHLGRGITGWKPVILYQATVRGSGRSKAEISSGACTGGSCSAFFCVFRLWLSEESFSILYCLTFA